MQQVSQTISRNSQTKVHSAIRTNAEKNWPQWKKEYYNNDFATSSHAIKFELKGTNKQHSTYYLSDFVASIQH